MNRRTLYLGISIALLAVRMFAWEKDLHYGLTKWLAFQAGFSLDDAETIAKGTQSPDNGKLYPAPGAVVHSACIGRDPDVSRLVQTYHFPGYGPVPGAAAKRSVDPGAPGDNAATDLVEKEVQTQLPHQPREKTLTNLGIALHPLEDSWSHQGEPDTPPWPCAKDLSWGHPAARNGWRKHDADLTFLHRTDTLATTARVYDFLVRFLNNHPAMKRDASRIPPPFSALAPAVEKFAEADNKQDKRTWFQSQPDVPFNSYSDQKFLDDINLPDSKGKKVAYVPDSTTRLGRLLPADQQYFPPNEVEAFVENFLTVRFIKHDTEGLLRYTDTRQLRDGLLQRNEVSSFKDADQAILSQSIFAMWLVKDHGYVNYLGHGLGEIAGSDKKLSTSNQLELLRKEPLIEVRSLRGPEMYFQVFESPEPGQYSVVIEFAHAPRDACVLTITKSATGSDSRLLVTRLDWYTL